MFWAAEEEREEGEKSRQEEIEQIDRKNDIGAIDRVELAQSGTELYHKR